MTSICLRKYQFRYSSQVFGGISVSPLVYSNHVCWNFIFYPPIIEMAELPSVPLKKKQYARLPIDTSRQLLSHQSLENNQLEIDKQKLKVYRMETSYRSIALVLSLTKLCEWILASYVTQLLYASGRNYLTFQKVKLTCNQKYLAVGNEK